MGHIAAQEPACTEEDRCPGHTHTHSLSLSLSLTRSLAHSLWLALSPTLQKLPGQQRSTLTTQLGEGGAWVEKKQVHREDLLLSPTGKSRFLKT